MPWKRSVLVAAVAAPVLLGACAYGRGYGPPPPGYAGEGWGRHVRRCLRHYPRYDPRTDLIYRANGSYRCPL